MTVLAEAMQALSYREIRLSAWFEAAGRLIVECAPRVSLRGANSSTMATQIESTALSASRPCFPVLLPKIEKIRWAPRLEVAYQDSEFTCTSQPVYAGTCT